MAMGETGIRLRPLAISDVLDETFRIYRSQFRNLVIVMGVVAIPLALLSATFNLVGGLLGSQASTSTGSLVAGMAVVLVTLPLAIVGGLARLMASAAVVRVVSNAILGQPIDIGAAYREAYHRLGPILGGSFLVGLAVGGLVLTCIGIPFAVYVGLGWMLLIPLILLEGLASRPAMRRSWDLVRGHRWRLLVSVMLIGLITWVLLSIPSALFAMVAGIILGLTQASQTWIIGMQVGSALLQALGETLFGSVGYITLVLLYYDLRIRKEAFDLQQRASAADLTTAPGQPTYAPGQPTYATLPMAAPPPPASPIPRAPSIPPPPMSPPQAGQPPMYPPSMNPPDISPPHTNPPPTSPPPASPPSVNPPPSNPPAQPLDDR